MVWASQKTDANTPYFRDMFCNPAQTESCSKDGFVCG